MIRLTLEFTDNLGPEADLATLIRKLDEALRGAPLGDAHVLVEARTLVDYVAETADGAWASVILTLRGPDTLAGVLAGCRDSLLELAEAHLAELYLRNSIVISSRLALHEATSEAERRHRRPPGPGF